METTRINCNQVQVSNKGRVCVFTQADSTLWAVCYGGEAMGTMRCNSTRPFQVRHIYRQAAQYLGTSKTILLGAVQEA